MRRLRERLRRARERLWDRIRRRHDAPPGSPLRAFLGKQVRKARRFKDKLVRRIKRRSKKVVLTSGPPHWGGCEDILRNEVEPVFRKAGVPITSGKRSETFGNPGSDHHTSQLTASARDAGTVNNYSLRNAVMRKLGVHVPIADYGAYYITRRGAKFRVQPIAGTHGTGPHLHIGIRRA